MKKLLIIFSFTILFFSIFLLIHFKVFSDDNKESSIENPTAIVLNKMWQTSDYWKPQTYDGHTTSGKYYAVDFYYNNRNRSEIYKNYDNGTSGRPILAPIAGPIYLHLLDVTSWGTGQFPFINAVRVYQGLDPVPQTCFSMTDSLGITVRIDMSLVIDHSSNSYRTLFSHLQIKNSYFNTTVTQKIRDGVRKFYNRTAVGSPRRVAISTGSSSYIGEQNGTIHNWGIANDYHLHFQLFNGSGYSESSPYLGTVQNLSNTTVVNIEGQIILNTNFEASIGGGVYQYPAMMRRTNLYTNDPIQVNTTWDGGGNINIRSSAGGTVIGSLPNGATGTLLNPNPTTAKIFNGTTYHLWYNVNVNSINGWIASEYFDKTSVQQYTITCSSNPTNGGSTSGCGTFPSGTIITIHASSNSGWSFVNWTEGSTIVSTTPDYSFTVTSNRNLVANFQQSIGSAGVLFGVTVLPYPVIMGSNLTTSFTLKETQGAPVTYEQITCAILKNDNSHCFDMDYANNITISANGTYYFTSTKQFPLGPYTPGNYKAMARGKPVGGNWFDFPTTGNGINPFSFPAQYPTFQISCSSNPSNGGSTSGCGNFQYGQSITVYANANYNWLFVNWKENGIIVSTNAGYTFTVSSNRNLVANFTPVSGLNQVSGIVPEEFDLPQNYPNPFNPNTKIRFDVPERANVDLRIYDVSGKEILRIVDKEFSQGRFEYIWDASGYSNGIYFCRMTANKFSKIIKLILIK